MKPRLSARLAVCILALGTAVFAQMPQPFSADMSTKSANGSVNLKGKYFLSLPRMRVDMADTGQRQGGPFGGKMSMIFDAQAKMAYMLMPDQHMYMEFPLDQNNPMLKQMPKFEDYKGDPCAGREAATCKKVGTETVNGRSCDKWEATRNGEKETFWIDQKLHFPVKSQTSGGITTEFTNIKEGVQDATLFKVPAGYQKFDPGAMSQRPR